jgi:hypothetical protein
MQLIGIRSGNPKKSADIIQKIPCVKLIWAQRWRRIFFPHVEELLSDFLRVHAGLSTLRFDVRSCYPGNAKIATQLFGIWLPLSRIATPGTPKAHAIYQAKLNQKLRRR